MCGRRRGRGREMTGGYLGAGLDSSHLHLPKLLLGGTIHFLHTLIFYLKTDHLPLHINPSVVHFPKQGIARTCPMFISSVGVFALQ